jgi:6-phosphogluconolactonase
LLDKPLKYRSKAVGGVKVAMGITEVRTSNQSELTAKLADEIEHRLREAVAERGYASMVVSGGNTPRPLFEILSRRRLPWKQITVTLADERWVEPLSVDSNEFMLRETLLRNEAAEAQFIPLKNLSNTAVEGQAECQAALTRMIRPFDLVILGMGDDGHTASLFPKVSGATLDTNKPDLCASIQPESAPYERMSLSASALLASQKIFLHIVGDNKWRVYQAAISPGNIDDMPVRLVLHQHNIPVEVYWSP